MSTVVLAICQTDGQSGDYKLCYPLWGS